MTVRAWRIVKARHAADGFSGEGARRFGGRWNSPGVSVVYAAGTPSLAMLEMLVHLESQDLLRAYVLFEMTFEEDLITVAIPEEIPESWRESPPSPAVQQAGDRWVQRGQSAVLRVPSAIVPNEWNYLLNPMHADYPKIVIGPPQPARFDPRLIRRPAY